MGPVEGEARIPVQFSSVVRKCALRRVKMEQRELRETYSNIVRDGKWVEERDEDYRGETQEVKSNGMELLDQRGAVPR